jgi:hypothetical protein
MSDCFFTNAPGWTPLIGDIAKWWFCEVVAEQDGIGGRP